MKHLLLQSGSAHRSPRALVVLLGLVVVVLALASCAASATQQPAPQTAAPAQASGQSITVSAKNFAFDPKELTVSPGTTVTWRNNDSILHTVTSDTGLFDSNLPAGADFQFTFNQPGTYAYYCKPHGGPGGKGMSGVIVVK